MGSFDDARKKIKHGEHLTTVDMFVESMRPAPYTSGGGLESSERLQAKALQRKREADEAAKRSK